MSQTESITTEHGRIEYETVDCDSCGAEVAKKDADRFVVIHDLKSKYSYTRYNEYKVRDGSDGWICPYCADSGPIDTPDKDPRSHVLGWILWATFSDRPFDAGFKMVMFIFTVFTILFMLSATGVI